MKKELTTTLAALRKYKACAPRYKALVLSLSKPWPDDAAINLLHILDSNGVQDMMWALRAAIPDDPRTRVAICADMAEAVLPVFERAYPGDKRPRALIEACHKFAQRLIDLRELQRFVIPAEDAAHIAYCATLAAQRPPAGDVTGYLTNVAHAFFAFKAAEAAVGSGLAADAPSYAAYAAYAADAAYAATEGTSRGAQVKIIRRYLK